MSHLDVLLVGVSQMEQTLLENFFDEDTSFSFADTANQASLIAKEKKPEVTICDAEAPGVDIRQICNDLNTNSPCVLLSSRDKDSERRKSLLKFKSCYLTRPYSQEQLTQAVSIAASHLCNNVA